MRTFVGFLFGHDSTSLPLFSSTAQEPEAIPHVATESAILWSGIDSQWKTGARLPASKISRSLGITSRRLAVPIPEVCGRNPIARFKLQFPANHRSGDLLNCRIREITTQVGLQGFNFGLGDFLGLVKPQIENPNRDPKPFNGCLVHLHEEPLRGGGEFNFMPPGQSLQPSLFEWKYAGVLKRTI
jgi:hypothetical protein